MSFGRALTVEDPHQQPQFTIPLGSVNGRQELEFDDVGSEGVVYPTTIGSQEIFVERLFVGYALAPLVNQYDIEGFHDVASFVKEKPSLMHELGRVYRVLKSVFENEKLKISVYQDPEEELDKELIIEILTRQAPDIALVALNYFDDLWEKVDSELEHYASVHLKYL